MTRTPLPHLPQPDTALPFERRPWDQRYCPHQYYRHDDGSTDCPACARDAANTREVQQ